MHSANLNIASYSQRATSVYSSVDFFSYDIFVI